MLVLFYYVRVHSIRRKSGFYKFVNVPVKLLRPTYFNLKYIK